MRKFLSVLMSLALMVTVIPQFAFADDEVPVDNLSGNCSMGMGCSCGCTCIKGEDDSLSCEFAKDCSCLKSESKGLLYGAKWAFARLWGFLSNDAAAMREAFSHFTWYQNIFNTVAVLLVSALIFRN